MYLLIGFAGAIALASSATSLDAQGAQVRFDGSRMFAGAIAQPASANSPLDRIVSLSVDRATLRTALDEVARRANVRIAYSGRVVPLDRRVSLRVDSMTVQWALQRLLRGTGASPRLDESTGQILLVASPPSLDLRSALVSTVRGTVRGSGAAGPLEGVTVALAGTQFGTVTRADGRYSISGVSAGTYRLEARRLGYARLDTSIVVRDGEDAVVDIALRATATQLDAIVTIGYGTTTRRDVTGAVASISQSEFKVPATPTVTLSSALQARAPGLQVISNTGLPGGGARVRIRGTGSLNANSEPLYVIDGLPAAQGTGSSNPQANPLMSIDPNEIESIEILKDASSTAIYGARGANGVVLISTRRGQRGESRTTVESSYGMQSISKKIDVLGGREFMELSNEARRNAGQSPLFSEARLGSAKTYDWPSMMIRDAAQQNHSITVSGGEQRLRYMLSGNLTEQEGIEIGSDFQRYGARLSLDGDITSRFRIGTTLSLTRVARNAAAVENGSLGNSANGIQAAMQFSPFTPPRDSLTGAWIKTSPTTEPVPNPVANASELTDLNTTSRLLGSARLEFDITPELRLSSTFGGNGQFDKIHWFAPRTILAGGVAGSGWIFSDETRDLTNETQLTYRQEKIGPGALNLLGGFSVQKFYSEFVQGNGSIFPVDNFNVFNLGSGAQLGTSSSGVSEAALLSYLGRAHYNIADRYLLTVTGRYDGSSKFGANNKWAFFPSIAGAWRLSDEPFLRGIGTVSDLKLRVSYGQVGNEAIARYQSLSALGIAWYSSGGTEIAGLAPSSSMPNPDLRWEQKTELNVGVDAGFLDDRITVSLDGYQSKTQDLLLGVSLPVTTGFTNQLRNIGSVQNRGVELSLHTVNINRPRFSWRSSFNVAANRNKILDMGTQDSILLAPRTGGFFSPAQTHILQEGKSISSIYGYVVSGLWQQGDACYYRVRNECTPGEIKIVDLNGDSLLTAAGDRRILGTGDPKFYGGLSNAVSFGPFSLDAFINFVQGNKIVNAGAAYGCMAIGQANERRCVLDRWTPTNTDATVPRANISRPRRLYSTIVEDGSYIRLQSLTLGYQIPRRFVPRMEAAQLFLTGQNLWLSTDYTDFDPDVNSMGGDARFGGTDIGAYPRTKTWNLGARLSF